MSSIRIERITESLTINLKLLIGLVEIMVVVDTVTFLGFINIDEPNLFLSMST